MFFGLIYGINEKPNYKSSLTFALEDDKSSGIGSGLNGAIGIASSFGIDLPGSGGGGAFAASNLAILMKSHLIIDKVLLQSYLIDGKESTLAEYYLNFSGLKEKWSKYENIKNIHFLPNEERKDFSRQKDSLLFIIHKEVTKKNNLDIIQKDKKITILSIEVNSKNETFSKLFCESVVNETSNFYIETRSKKARLNTDVLQMQVDSVRKVLNNSISKVAMETDFVYNLNPSLNSKAVNSKKNQVDVTASTEVLKQLTIQLELSKITLRKETPLVQLIDIPRFPLETDKIGIILSVMIGMFSFPFFPDRPQD